MPLTILCLVLSFLFSLISSAVLFSASIWVMLLKLLVAVVAVIGFIRAVVQQGRQPIWGTLWMVVGVTAVLLVAYLLGYTSFDAGYVPLMAGYILGLNVLVVGEAAHRLSRTNPRRSLQITATVTLAGVGLGWLVLLVLRFLAYSSAG